MVYPDLIAYIREQTRQGASADTIRQVLLSASWSELDIENALHDVAAGLKPITEGVSIHEDLAQVRGMVAHLASRVRTLEGKLVSAGMLPMAAELPSGALPLLPVAHRRSSRLIVLIFVLAILSGIAAWMIWGL